MKYVLASVLTAGSGLASLVFLVFLMAGGANSSPKQIAQIKAWMLAAGVIALCGIAGAVWAMVAGRPLTGAWIGAFPGAFCIVVLTVMYIVEW
jgi:hypothetical protein